MDGDGYVETVSRGMRQLGNDLQACFALATSGVPPTHQKWNASICVPALLLPLGGGAKDRIGRVRSPPQLGCRTQNIGWLSSSDSEPAPAD